MARTTGKKTGKKTAKATKTTKATKASKATKATKNAKATKAQAGGNVEDAPATRYYKLITIEQDGAGEDVAVCRGRYSGKKPRQASSKGCTKLFRAYKDRDEEYPANIVFGMHECTRSRKKKKKFFYVGTKEDLDEPQEVPIHQKGDNGEYLLDKKGNKVPKLDPKTGKPLVIRYRTNSRVKKLACPEIKERVEVDGERRTVQRALTEEEYNERYNEENPAPYTFGEYTNVYAQFNLLRNYDAPDEEDEVEAEAEAAPAPKKAARAKATKATKGKASKTAKAANAKAKATKATKNAPVVKKTTSKNITVKKNASKGKKAAPKKAAAKKGGRKTTAKKN